MPLVLTEGHLQVAESLCVPLVWRALPCQLYSCSVPFPTLWLATPLSELSNSFCCVRTQEEAWPGERGEQPSADAESAGASILDLQPHTLGRGFLSLMCHQFFSLLKLLLDRGVRVELRASTVQSHRTGSRRIQRHRICLVQEVC